MDIALLDLISTEPAYLDSIPISPGRLIAVSHEGSPTKGELYWDAEDGTRKCIGSNISEIEAQLDGKADLVDGKVKKEQLPEIQTDQVVEQPATPTSPNTILWVDTDAETPGVDIEGIKATAEGAKAEAELAHTTADSAVTRLNSVDETIAKLTKETHDAFNDVDMVQVDLDDRINANTTQIGEFEKAIASITVPDFSKFITIRPNYYINVGHTSGLVYAVGNMLYISLVYAPRLAVGPSTKICDFTIPIDYPFTFCDRNFTAPYFDTDVFNSGVLIRPNDYSNPSDGTVAIYTAAGITQAGNADIGICVTIPLIARV